MLEGDLATLATLRQRKCSHRVCNPSAAGQHRDERGRASLFPGIYLWVPQAPRCGQAECDNIPGGSWGESCEPWGDSLIVAAGFKTESQEQGELIQPLRQIRQLLSQALDQGAGSGILLGSSRGPAPCPGGGREAGAGGTSTPVPPCSSVCALGGVLVSSRLTFCWRKAEGETENTNNEELARDEEVWVNPASYHSTARGHGYPSAAIWRLQCWGIPLIFPS